MSVMRSFGAKLSGKRINAVSKRAGTVSDKVPMKKRASIVDKDRISIVCIGDGNEPILGIECEEKAIDLNHMRGVFRDGEILDASVENGYLYLAKGKDTYWFPLTDFYDGEAYYPKWEASTEFRMDPRKLSDIYGKDLKNGYAKLIADYDDNGEKIVRAFIFTDREELKDSVVLAGTWVGEPSVSRFPMDRLKNIGVFGKDVVARMSTDYPLELVTDDTVHSSYLIAPRISYAGDDLDEIEMKEKEKEGKWVGSHNVRGSIKHIIGSNWRQR